MKKLSVLLGIIALIYIGACGKGGGGAYGGNNNPPPPPPPTVNCATVPKAFAADVNPIIQSVCATDATCHGSGSINGPGPLLTYSQIYNARDKIGPAVASGLMPKVGTLSTGQKNTIHCWIDAGAPNN
jgi:hypothetical protein